MKAPNDCEVVTVNIKRTMRYKHYKRNSQQFNKGTTGRWQLFNGYGWDNCEAPDAWEYQNTAKRIE